MTSPVAAIGAAAGRALSGAVHGLHGIGKGLEFAGQLDQKLQTAGAAANPMAFIVNHIAADIASAVVKSTGNQGNAAAQSTLQRAMASALAPPGTSPPGNGTQLAALLQQQLTNLVTRLTEGTANAGQQNEVSGTVLDANSAREIPAQQTKLPAGAQNATPSLVASYVQSLLNAVSNATGANASPAAGPGNPGQAAATAPPAVQAQPLPDILARMLVRAANADAQRGGEVAFRAVPASGSTTTLSPSTTQTAAGNAALFDRLIAIVAEQQSGSQSGTGEGKGQSQGFASAPQAQNQSSVSQTASFAAQAASAQPSNVSATVQTPSPAHASVDPNAVIEQIVKGLSMRTFGSSSELQLRLQPEHLGNVSLKLTVTGNTITANVIAQNPDVREALLSNQQQLVRSLAEAGLSLGKFSVDVSGGNTAFTQQQSQRHANFGRTITAGGSLLANEETNWEDQRYGPAVTGSISLMFNYLA